MADVRKNAKKLADLEKRKLSKQTENEGPNLVDYYTRNRVGDITDNFLDQKEDLQRQAEEDFKNKKYASGAAKKFLEMRLSVPTAVSAALGSVANTAMKGKPLRGSKSVYEDPESYTKNPQSYKKGGSVSSASKRADGRAVKGKTKGKVI